LAWFAEGDEEPWGTDGANAWEGSTQGEVRIALGAWRNGVVAVLEGGQGYAELGGEGLHQEGMGTRPRSSVVSGVACVMAWRRGSLTAASRR
jgi:hypothetical protein